jgi:hypothetical protein
MAHPLHRCLLGYDIEGTARPHCHAPDVGSLFLAYRDDCPHGVPGLEALDPFGLLRPRAREAVLVHPAHLP